MFRFANPEYIYLLAIIPLFIAGFIFFCYKKKKDLKQFGTDELLKELIPNFSNRRPKIKFYMLLTILFFAIIILARPQFGTKMEKVNRKGVEVIIAIDVSNSMLAEDLTPSRLDKAKQIVANLTDYLVEDKLGMIVFAGEAYTQLPLTSDNVSAKMFLPSINTDIVPTQGTAIGAAIETAVSSFGPKSETGRAIVVITDGENHEDDAIEAAKAAAKEGIIVHVIGMGSTEGAPIPIPGSTSFKEDNVGNIVVSKLNEEMCQSLAEAGLGAYVRADNSNKASKYIIKQIDNMAKSDIQTEIYSGYNDQFQILAAICVLLLIIELFILERQNNRLSRIKLFE